MKAAIITIGDEILIGQIVDTNSAFISSELNQIGISVGTIESISDTSEAITESLGRLMAKYDLVITTGGIGPTKDDITKNTLADIFGMKLVIDPSVEKQVQTYLEVRGIEFNSLNREQALVPSGATVLPNNNGTAPGLWLEKGSCVVVTLPGVPYEMKALMKESVLPSLKERFALNPVIHHTVVTYGISESELAQRLEEWENSLGDDIKLAYLPNPSFLRLRLSSYNVKNPQEIEQKIEDAKQKLYSIIGDNILGEGSVNLEQVVSKMLRSSGQTLSVAESCTGGAIASCFTQIAGSSDIFLAGVVSYANQAKISILGVDKSSIETHGAVSEQVAREMAQGIRRISGSTYSIATTGIAGPGGGSPTKPVGTLWIAVSTPRGTYTQKKEFGTLRVENIARFAASAINLLLQQIVKETK